MIKLLCVAMILRTFISLAVMVFSFICFEHLISEWYIALHMEKVGAPDREALSEDYGLGLVGLLIIVPCSFILSVMTAKLTWSWLGRRDKSKNT
ncbi:MAG TPA: hypothetical protein DF774_16470 [Rheinheimera sp.]|nr:hypothetical protein [Rheinheimera sp.]